MYPSVIWRVRGKLLNSIYSDTDVPCQWLSITITPSVYVVDIIISLNDYCTCTDADDMKQLTTCIFCGLLSIDKMKENKQYTKIV